MKFLLLGGSSMKKLLLLFGFIIPFAFILANNGVVVTQSNPLKIILSVSLPQIEMKPEATESGTFSVIGFAGADRSAEVGSPQLPVIRELVEIPYDASVNIEVNVLKSEKVYPKYPILPLQPPIPKSGPAPVWTINQDIYNQDSYLQNIRAQVEMIGEIRGHRVALIEIYPVWYNPKQNLVEYVSEMTINMNLIGSNMARTEQMHRDFYSLPYEMMLSGLVKNYDEFTLSPPPDLPVGYLIIVPDEWSSNVTPLAEWRTRKGYKVFVRTVSQAGGSGSTAIRNYILQAYNTWTIRPTFVLLVGDVDKIGYFVGTGTGTPNTDLNYSMMTTPDYFPDIDVSRASVANSAQLDSLIQKTIKYEQNQWINGTDWAKKGLFIASADGSYHGVAEGTHRYCQAKVRSYGMIADSIYLYYTSGAPAIITTKINEGRAWVTYSGHGSETSWSEPPYSTTNVHQLANIDKVPLVGSFCCLSGNFAYSSECFSESWIRSGYRGAIANYASSVNSYWTEDDTLQRRVFDYSFDSSYYWAMGMLNKAKIRYYTQMGNTGMTRRYFEMYNMMGDGAIDVYSDIPATLTVNYPSVIPLGTYTIPVSVTKGGNPVQNALVCAKIKNDTTFTAAYTNILGQASLQITTNSPDSVYITVTGHNLAPHLGSVMALSSGGPYMMYLRHMILDPLPGGNNDGLINPGEAVEMRIWFKNFGSGIANNVRAWLRTTDLCITITDSFKNLGNVNPNDSAYTPDGFNFSIATSCTNNYNLQLTLTIKDASDSTWQSNIALTVAQCILQHVSTQVNDPAPGGNNNGIINRGETVNLIATIRNIGGATANNVASVLSTTASGITILDANGNFDSIPKNSTANNSADPYTISADSTVVSGTIAQFRIIASSGFYTDTFYFSLPIEIYIADFENNNGSYVPNPLTGAWEWGVPTSGPNGAHSGTKLWATVLGGNYANSANWTLTTPVFTATSDNPQLKFWHWYYFEGASTLYDGGNVKISTNNGQNWTVVTPVDGYTGTAYASTPGVGGQPIFSGSHQTWTEVTFNLPVTNSQQFLLRWHFGSDGSINYPGWYIDDVTGIGFTNILSGISEGSQSINYLTTMLYAPKPNPVVNGIAHISYSIAEPSKMTLKIYDASGRVIKILVNGQVERGIYNLIWDGRDDNHRSVAEGIYFYTLETPKQNFTKKLIFTR